MSYTVSCVTTLEEAKAAWDLLSPHEHLMDEWAYRYLYFQYTPFTPQFYVLYKKKTPVALLPLQMNNEGVVEFFGGRKFYKNSIFMHDTNADSYKLLFAAVHDPMRLEMMNEPIPGLQVQEEETGYYILPLNGLKDWHSYLEKDWHGKSKKNLKSQMKKIESLGIEIIEDDNKDLKILAEYNLAQFKEHSHFNKPHRLAYLQELMNVYSTKILSIRHNSKTIAVGFSIVFNNTYYSLTSGHDVSVNNLGKYLILCRIEQAIKAGAHFYEAGRHDYGWKEKFHFIKKNLYISA